MVFSPANCTNYSLHPGTHTDTHIVGVPDKKFLLWVIGAKQLYLGSVGGRSHVLDVIYVVVVHPKDVVIVAKVCPL